MVLGHAHVGIKVADLSRSVQFYQTHFGFTAGKYNELHRENKITKIQFLELGQFSLELVENPGYPGGEPSPKSTWPLGWMITTAPSSPCGRPA